MSRLITKLSIGHIMFLFIAIGFAVALFFAQMQLRDKMEKSRELESLPHFATLSRALGMMVHELQSERGMTLVYLTSGGTVLGPELQEQRARVDKMRDTLDARIAADRPFLPAPVAERVTALSQHLETLLVGRQAVDGRAISPGEAAGAYTEFHHEAFSEIGDLAQTVPSGRLSYLMQRHSILLSAKDMAGLERAVGASGLSMAASDTGTGVFKMETLIRFRELINQQSALHNHVLATSSDAVGTALQEALMSDVAQQIKEWRTSILDDDAVMMGDISVTNWFAAQTAKLDMLLAVERQSGDILQAEADAAAGQAQAAMTQNFILLGVALLASSVLCFVIYRSYRAALTRIFAPMEALAKGDTDVDIPNMTRHELGQVASGLRVFRDNAAARKAAVATEDKARDTAVKEIADVIESCKNGHFDKFIDLDTKTGTFQTLSAAINDIVKLSGEAIDTQNRYESEKRANREAAEKRAAKASAELAAVVEACSNGDFSQRVPEDDKTGSFLDLSKGVNRISEVTEHGLEDIRMVLAGLAEGDLTREMHPDHHGLFGDIRDAAQRTTQVLASIVNDINGSATLVGETAGELGRSGVELAARTEEQNAAVQSSSETISALARGATDNAKEADDGAKMALTLRDVAQGGARTVSEAVEAIGHVESASSRIADITSTIDEIAFQTNLLALNASVEAARAGSAGKGFAVVATEVRGLAGRCADASQQIAALIAENVREVEGSARHVKNSGEVFEQIRDGIEPLVTMISAIAERSSEQSERAQTAQGAVAEIAVATNQNAELTQQYAAVTETLAHNSETLRDLIGFFNVDGMSKRSDGDGFAGDAVAQHRHTYDAA